MAAKTKETWKINTLVKANDVLRLFSDKKPYWTFNEIQKELHLPKSSLSNLLRTLEFIKLIIKDEQSQLYSLSVDILEMSFVARKALPIIDTASNLLDEIQIKTGNIVYFTIPKDGEVLYLDARYPNNKNVVFSVMGKTLPMHCTGVGKAMLSKMTNSDVESIIEQHGMNKFTDTTIVDYDDLVTELSKINELGYAIDEGEESQGVRCIAVPITAYGRVLGALSISGSPLSVRHDDFDFYASILIEAANYLSQFSHLFPKNI